jgi:hypothetical protein
MGSSMTFGRDTLTDRYFVSGVAVTDIMHSGEISKNLDKPDIISG